MPKTKQYKVSGEGRFIVMFPLLVAVEIMVILVRPSSSLFFSTTLCGLY